MRDLGFAVGVSLKVFLKGFYFVHHGGGGAGHEEVVKLALHSSNSVSVSLYAPLFKISAER